MRSFLILLGTAPVLFAAPYTLELGLKTILFDYTETSGSEVLDTENSDFGKVAGGYARASAIILQEESYEDAVEFYGMHTAGTTRYVGSLIGSDEGYGSFRSTTDNTYDEIQFNYARRYTTTTSFSQLVKLGLGYYEWERALSESQIEIYHWYFAQLTIGVDKRFQSGWSAGLEVTGRYAFDQKMDADLPGNTNATFDLGNVYTFKANLPLSFPINDSLSLVTGAEVEYTEIGKSNVINGFFEPDSEQTNWHLYLGGKLRF